MQIDVLGYQYIMSKTSTVYGVKGLEEHCMYTLGVLSVLAG